MLRHMKHKNLHHSFSLIILCCRIKSSLDLRRPDEESAGPPEEQVITGRVPLAVIEGQHPEVTGRTPQLVTWPVHTEQSSFQKDKVLFRFVLHQFFRTSWTWRFRLHRWPSSLQQRPDSTWRQNKRSRQWEQQTILCGRKWTPGCFPLTPTSKKVQF